MTLSPSPESHEAARPKVARLLEALRRRLPSSLFLVLGVALLLVYSTMFPSVSAPNERSRVYLAVAVVDHGTIRIDEPVHRFGTILDIARHEGHLYSDKAPGSSLIAAALYGAVRVFTRDADWTIEQLIVLMRTALMVPIGLLGFWLVRRLLTAMPVKPALVDLASTGWILGTAAFHYSAAFYGHQIAATCLLAALYLVERAEQLTLRHASVGIVLACGSGACAGLAGVTEYQAGVLSLLLALYLVSGPLRHRVSVWLGFTAGALPFLLLLGVYHSAAFGGPFELSYHHLAHSQWQKIHTQGIGGVTWPHAEAFFGSTLSLHRGLFSTSPMFFFAVAGAPVLWLRGRRRLALLLVAATGYALLLVSSSNMWVAGWSYGPRLLVPMMGWATLLVAVGAEWASMWRIGEVLVRATIAFGIASNQLVRAVFPEPPPQAENPWVDVVGELLARDLVAPNLLSEHFGVEGILSLAPAMLVVAATLVMVLFRPLTERPPATRAAVAGASALLVAAAATGIVARGPTMPEREQRGFQRFLTSLQRTERPRTRILSR